MEFFEDAVVSTFECFNMLMVISKLDFLSNYREIRASLNTTLRFLILVLLLHALSIASSCLHRLISRSVFLYSVNNVAFYVLAHVLVSLIADCSVADGAWGSSPAGFIVFDFLATVRRGRQIAPPPPRPSRAGDPQPP